MVAAVLLLGRLGSAGVLAAQTPQPKIMAPHKAVPPVLTTPQPLHKSAVARSLVGGLWMTDAGMKSYVHVTNDLVTSPLTVSPVLWLSNGVSLHLPAITIEPSGTAVISVNEALADQRIAPYATLSGYVELDYQWPWDAICATMRNVDVACLKCGKVREFEGQLYEQLKKQIERDFKMKVTVSRTKVGGYCAECLGKGAS
jgi:hypothetical protein